MADNGEYDHFPLATNPEGSILSLFCELPHTLDAQRVGFALLELEAEIGSMREPPVASIQSLYGAVDMEDKANALEDYRRFYVEFTKHATEEDMHAAVSVVMSAMRRLSRENR